MSLMTCKWCKRRNPEAVLVTGQPNVDNKRRRGDLQDLPGTTGTAKRQCWRLEQDIQRFWMPFGKDGEADAEVAASGSWMILKVLSDPSEETFNGVGAHLWSASCILTQLLVNPFALGPSWVKRLIADDGFLKVLELGAGTALPSSGLAKCGHHVTATDLPDILPLTLANVEANIEARKGTVVVKPLIFGDAVSAMHAGSFDLVIGSEIAYDPTMYGPLLATLKALTCKWVLLAIAWRPEDLGDETFENYCQDEGVPLEFRHTALGGSRGSHRVNVYEIDMQKWTEVQGGELEVKSESALFRQCVELDDTDW